MVRQVAAILSSFRIADDTTDVTERLLALLQKHACGGRQVHDANVVATMLAYGIDALLTHNIDDFRRFSDEITVIPIAREKV